MTKFDPRARDLRMSADIHALLEAAAACVEAIKQAEADGVITFAIVLCSSEQEARDIAAGIVDPTHVINPVRFSEVLREAIDHACILPSHAAPAVAQ